MKLKRWLRGWIVASFVAPLVHLGIYIAFGYTLGEGIFVFWPGVIGLMVLENRPSVATIILVWVMLIASNVLLYTVIAIFLWSIARIKSKDSLREPKEI